MDPSDSDSTPDGEDYALENQVPMSSVQFMEMLKADATSPKHPILTHADTPHPFSPPFSREPEDSSLLVSNPPSPFNVGATAATSTRPPRSILNDRQKLNPARETGASSSSKKDKGHPSPFKKLAINAIRPESSEKGYESDGSVHYDLNDLVFTPSPLKNGPSLEEKKKSVAFEQHEGEDDEIETKFSENEFVSGLTSQATITKDKSENKLNRTESPEVTSFTYEPPTHAKNAWGSLRILSLLMKPFKDSAKAVVRDRTISDASSNISDIDENESPNATGGTKVKHLFTTVGTKIANAQHKIRRDSLVDVAKKASQKHQEILEFEELQNSVGQFRNPMFETRFGINNSSTRMTSGIYKAKARTRRTSITPSDVVDITKEMSLDKNSNIMTKQISIKPHRHEKPANLTEWVLDSDSKTYQRFYLFLLFLIVTEACVLPFQFVFYEKGGNEDAPYAYKIYHLLVTLCYVLDLYISFHLTYVDKKSGVIVDLSMIGQHYMNSNEFKIDAMSAIPFDLFGIFIGDIWWWTTYIKLFKSFRLLHLKKVKRLSDNQTVINMGRIMWVLVLFIVVMHIMACMWYQLSFYEEKHLDDNHSWMRYQLEGIIMAQSREGFGDGEEHGHKTITEFATLADYTCTSLDSNKGISLVSTNECFTQFRQYLLSLYAVMMILVQDGVDPTTEIECLFAIFFGMFGMVVGAVLVGQTADIIGNLHRSETRYRNKLDDVTEQLRNLEISGQTRRRVFEYLDFIWTVNKGLNRERILGELSDNLKCEVLVAVHGEVIKKIPFFDIDQIPELLVHVVQLLKSSYYLPGDVIVHEHEKTVDTSCMYFIVYGNVAAYHMREPNKILHLMSKGDFFGEIAYLARGARRTASICAASNSDVASLMFSDVDRLIHLFPEMKTRMESELKKHMAYTEEGRKYIKAATRMEKVQVGSILMHETRGEGIVIKIDNHKRRHVQYKNGDIHKYLPTSWHKIKLIKEGKGTLNENIWDMREPGIKEESSREGTTPVSSNAGEGGSAGPEKDMSGKVMSFAKKMLKKRRDRSKKWSKPSPFKAQKSNSSHTR